VSVHSTTSNQLHWITTLLTHLLTFWLTPQINSATYSIYFHHSLTSFLIISFTHLFLSITHTLTPTTNLLIHSLTLTRITYSDNSLTPLHHFLYSLTHSHTHSLISFTNSLNSIHEHQPLNPFTHSITYSLRSFFSQLLTPLIHLSQKSLHHSLHPPTNHNGVRVRVRADE